MLNQNKKLLVSDYDQTFYINDEDIEENKKLVERFRKKGNIFIIATGRSYLDFQDKVNKYKLEYDYVIINHGATILDKNDNVLFNFSINNVVINDIKKDLHLSQTLNHFCCSKLESRVGFEYNDLTKINAKYSSREEAFAINDIINTKYSNYVHSYYVTENSVEIISNKINKSRAISLLLNQFNILKKNVYTIGDGYSDIEMIKDFNGYAMINSVEELKKVAINTMKSVSDLINNII